MTQQQCGPVAARSATAPGVSLVSNDKVLRFSQAGHCYPPRLDRTNRALPHGSSLAANRDPYGFLDKGDAMIRRPYLVAWPVMNPTPASAVHPSIEMNRSKKT
jgi:hypothetical protein